MPKNRIKSNAGLTLLEVVIGMTIMTIASLSFISAMGTISKSIRMSKSTMLASNLAQEKVESLKNLSYFRLLVTTASASAVTASGTFYYDTGYYPEEDLVVGQITFKRGVLVQKVTESGGSLSVNNWYDNDTGLKLITVNVAWLEGGVWKRTTVTNVRDNSNRAKVDAKFSGTVTSGGSPVQNVTVQTLQDPLLRAGTNASGFYSISVPAGSYELKAALRGYFPAIISSTVASSGNQTVDFTLTAMGFGGVKGLAYLRNHLVIAKVCAAVGGDDNLEYVELYNPTESTYTMHNGISPSYQIDYVRTSDGNIATLNPNGTTRYVNPTLYPHSYYLLASSAVVGAMAADAYYSDAGLTNIVPANLIPTAESGGIRLYSLGTYEAAGTNVDAVGWGRSGGAPYGPALAREGNGLQLSGSPGHSGLSTDQTLERMAYSTSTAATMSVGGAHVGMGHSFDSNANENDWIFHNDTLNSVSNTNNTTINAIPQSGTPAAGAAVYVGDGLSASSVASSTGAFYVPMVATGTWSITVSSSGWIYSRDSAVAVTNNATTDLGVVALTAAGSFGFVSGRVVQDGGSPLSGISVETSGAADTTDLNGYYHMQLNVGTYTIVANQNNAISLYTTGLATGVVVNIGQDITVPDIVLYQGGKLRGFVTANGIDPLPGIPIVAAESTTSAEKGNAISDAQGYFLLPDLPVDTYVLTPQLETAESASPSNYSSTVVAGSTVFVGTFTVSNAFGTLRGTVSKNGSPISTGVMIMAVATPNTIGTNPPAITPALRSGSTIYYAGTSQSDGTYSLSLRAGTYNVYGWYTTLASNTATTTRLALTASVTAGGSAVLNFSW
jgi:hypothetical protein